MVPERGPKLPHEGHHLERIYTSSKDVLFEGDILKPFRLSHHIAYANVRPLDSAGPHQVKLRSLQYPHKVDQTFLRRLGS